MKVRYKANPSASEAGDYGPAFTRRGDAKPIPAWDGATSGLELADVPDIDRPGTTHTIRVARRRDPLIALLEPRKDGPGRAQFMAAERFRTEFALSQGVKGGGEFVAVDGGRGGMGGLDIMVTYAHAVRAAWLAIHGPERAQDVADIISCVVLGYATLDAYKADGRHVSRGTLRQALDTGLNRLVDHYEGHSRNRA